jgi:hypothetical protein
LVNITSIIRLRPYGERKAPVDELWIRKTWLVLGVRVLGSEVLGSEVLGSEVLGSEVPGSKGHSGFKGGSAFRFPEPRSPNPEPTPEPRTQNPEPTSV